MVVQYDGNHCKGEINLRFTATYYDVDKYIRECIESIMSFMSVHS